MNGVWGKECALLLAAATDVQEEAKGMLESYQFWQNLHWHSVGEVVAYGVDKRRCSKLAYLEQAQEVRFSLNFRRIREEVFLPDLFLLSFYLELKR